MKAYRKSIKFSLIIVYLVIVAGAVVRMTGSGMGCPDWPKCFGYYIPPTDVEEIKWHPNQHYFEGQIIIVDESLKAAKEDFVAGEEFNNKNWEAYTKHSYAKFNPSHTWVEYINRLFGALSGVAVLIMAILSFRMWNHKKRLTLVSLFTLALLMFQAWLGATVVYSELLPIRITIHMIVALVIVALLIYLLSETAKTQSDKKSSKIFTNLLVIGLILSLIQVALGTQVRQAVDDFMREFGSQGKIKWIEEPGIMFYIHRSFSFLVVIVNVLIWWINKKKKLGFSWTDTLLFLILIEIISGIAMYYFEFPFGSQAAHLVFASLLFGTQTYLLLLAKKTAKKQPEIKRT
ncbi:MAG: COX15/CtaA family protein [Bacteroidota bacterium]